MARMTKAQKIRDNMVEAAMRAALNGIVVDIMDLSKMRKELEAAYDAGTDLAAAATQVSAKYAHKDAA